MSIDRNSLNNFKCLHMYWGKPKQHINNVIHLWYKICSMLYMIRFVSIETLHDKVCFY